MTIQKRIEEIKNTCENWTDNKSRVLCSECCREIKGLQEGYALAQKEKVVKKEKDLFEPSEIEKWVSVGKQEGIKIGEDKMKERILKIVDVLEERDVMVSIKELKQQIREGTTK